MKDPVFMTFKEKKLTDHIRVIFFYLHYKCWWTHLWNIAIIKSRFASLGILLFRIFWKRLMPLLLVTHKIIAILKWKDFSRFYVSLKLLPIFQMSFTQPNIPQNRPEGWAGNVFTTVGSPAPNTTNVAFTISVCRADKPVVRNRIKLGLLANFVFFQSFFEGQSASWDVAKKDQNRAKNRYGNIIACKFPENSWYM